MTQERRKTVHVFAVLLALLATACSSPGKVAEPAVPPPVAEKPAALSPTRTAREAALEQQVATLELRVLEKSALVDELQVRLDDARREVVRSMAKLATLATRAEAASGIAESELALQSLSASASAERVAELRRLMEQSSAEFNKENYGGALYLANQVKSAATTAGGQLPPAEQGSARPGERALALPLRLETTSSVNVREGPGVRFAVLFTLPARTQVVAYSSSEQWLRIADDSGRRGWVSQSLIRGQP